MALDRLVSMGLRASELVFAAIVAGVTGDYLHHTHAGAWHLGRFIYTEVVAGLSIFLALLWLIPFSSTFVHWPVDIFISVLWWVVFGLLVDVSINHLQPRQHADSPSWSAAAAAPSSTGATSPPAATSAASSRPTSPSPSCRPFSGSSRPSSASSGFRSVSSALPGPMPPTLAAIAGTAAATFRQSLLCFSFFDTPGSSCCAWTRRSG